MGRKHEKFVPDVVEALLDRLATGKESLAAICRDPDMPGLRTVYDWIEQDADFAARFRARKAIGVRAMVDDCIEIADEGVADAVEVANKRVRIDTRLRLAGKWLRDEFGDKVSTEVTGRDGGPIEHDVSVRHDADAFTRAIVSLAARSGEDEASGEPVG